MTQIQLEVDLTGIWCRALTGEDRWSARDLFDAASLLHVPGRSGLAGQYQGGEAILGLLDHMLELTGGTLRFLPTRVLSSETHAILWGHLRATRLSAHLATKAVHVLSLRSGTVRDIWMFHEHQDLVDEFWAAQR